MADEAPAEGNKDEGKKAEPEAQKAEKRKMSSDSGGDKPRRMSIQAAEEERPQLPDKGVPPDFLICCGLLILIGVIFFAICFGLLEVVRGNGIFALERDRYKI